MTLNFNMAAVALTEFGVGRDDQGGQSYVAVPVDAQAQAALREMVAATWIAMKSYAATPETYEPAEKHGGTEYLTLPLEDALATGVRNLHQAENLPLSVDALNNPGAVFCYFVRLTDDSNRRVTGLRRASQFKGILKSRLLRFDTDTLTLAKEQYFRLDSDFDLLIDEDAVHILRPSGFEFAGGLQEAILAAVPTNVGLIQKDLGFVDFAPIQVYATSHPRAARYLASIRGQKETHNVDRVALKRVCKSTGVDVKESKGRIIVAVGHEMGFLEVLDRRRYELELVKGQPERFRATSRQRLAG